MEEGILYLVVEIVCLLGCIWAHMPWKKTLGVLLLAPVVVFGSFFMIIAATAFIAFIIAFILGKLGFEAEQVFWALALMVGTGIVSTITWLYFSNEREINLRTAKKQRALHRHDGLMLPGDS